MEKLSGQPVRRTLYRFVATGLLVVYAGNGCAAYVPAPAAQPLPTGERVKLQFRTPRDVRMGDVTANDVRTLIGEVVQYRGDTLTVAGFRAIAANGYETLGPGENVAVHQEEIATLDVSRLSVSRSAGLTALLVGLTALVGTALKNAGSSGGGGPPPGGEQ